MKIKQKKKLNLPQLIEWAMENDVTDRMFLTENSYCVGFDRHGFIYFNSSSTMPLYQTFTVEVEEEIDEDIEFKSLVEVTTESLFAYWEHTSINTWKDVHSKEFHAYIDGEFKCVWRDGKMVD